MKLAFNCLNSGLGNNGGSRTIIKCAEVLEQLGHRCDIIATVDNFTWFDHKPVMPYIAKDLDAIIATACTTVDVVVKVDLPGKAWYIRAHEDWAMNEIDLIRRYNSGLLNIVNARGLQEKLKSYGADSVVVYQGLDFDWWENRELRPKNKIRIGALHTKQSRKRWKDFVKLAEILGTQDYEYVGIGSATPEENFLTDFKLNANVDELNNVYSSCHIWFAPTESEGLHNVPMEAALCGCLVVCSDHPLNGMVLDYAFENTAMIYDFGDIKQAAELIRDPDWSLVENMQDVIRTEIGTRKQNMKKMVEYLERTK